LQALGMDLKASAALTFLPWAVMAVCSPSSGFLADHLISRGTPVAVVRRSMQAVAFVVPALMLLLLSSVVVSPQVAAACMAVALGANAVALAGYVADMSDVAPRHAGKMFGYVLRLLVCCM
jgi:MFS family permease